VIHDIERTENRAVSGDDAGCRQHDRRWILMMPTIMVSIGSMAMLGWLVTVPGAFIMGYMFARLAQVRPKAGGLYACPRVPGRFCRVPVQSALLVLHMIANIAIAASMTGYLTVFVPALRNP